MKKELNVVKYVELIDEEIITHLERITGPNELVWIRFLIALMRGMQRIISNANLSKICNFAESLDLSYYFRNVTVSFDELDRESLIKVIVRIRVATNDSDDSYFTSVDINV